MYKIGIVGTSSITLEFLNCIRADFSKKCTVVSVYSRNDDTCQKYISENCIDKGFTNFDLFLDSADVIYIASPNGIHYSQAKQAIIKSKHLIIEKPMAMTYDNLLELYDLSYLYNVLIIEAIVSVCNPLINDLKKYMINIKHANFNMMQQTRFIDDYKNNNHVNVFDPSLGGGVMYDLAIYPVYLALILFSDPIKCNVFSIKEKSYSPLTSNIILEYKDFNCNINVSKVSSSPTQSYISTLDYLIIIDNVAILSTIKIYDHKNNLIQEYSHNIEHKMSYEIQHFFSLLDNDIFVSDKHTKELSFLANNIISKK